MDEPGYFGGAPVIDAMSAEHRYLWRALFKACEPCMKPGMRVLDFGCGNGSMLSYLLQGDGAGWPGYRCGFAVGIDRPAMSGVLARAADRIDRTHPLLLSSAPASAFPRQFDLVLSHEVVYLLPSLTELFAELHSSLRADGTLVLATGCHTENALYPRWRAAFDRAGVRTYPYREADYVRALHEAGFADVGTRRLHLSGEEYREWVAARGAEDPNPEWFLTADEERRYYTEHGKALILARKTSDRPPLSGARNE
jgi:SAM-dependent methyltransferase